MYKFCLVLLCAAAASAAGPYGGEATSHTHVATYDGYGATSYGTEIYHPVGYGDYGHAVTYSKPYGGHAPDYAHGPKYGPGYGPGPKYGPGYGYGHGPKYPSYGHPHGYGGYGYGGYGHPYGGYGPY